MRSSLRSMLVALTAAAMMIAMAACGDEKKEKGTAPAGGGAGASGQAIQKNAANAKTAVTVGSKNFTEQFILGEIYAQALEAAGFKVKKELNLGSELIAFKALRGGQIDAYPEYTGTALTSFFKVKTDQVPKQPQQAFDQLTADLAKDDITALAPTPFENTYRLGLTKKKAAELGNPKNISDLTGKSQQLVINGFPECKQRTDCLLGVQKTYGLKFKKFLASESKFEVLDKGQADVAFVFTTDAPLATKKYVVLEDDKKLFPPYNITFMVRNETLQKIGPQGRKVLEDVGKPLTVAVMQELNSRVDLDKQEPEKVATDYLKESGFTK